jgi:SanA protein
VLALVVAAANAYVLLYTNGEATDEVAEVPRAEVAIVPGAFVEPSGRLSAMLAARVEQASRLWHAGKVEKILVSGDHRSWDYDEPDTMRKALVRDGVAPQDIFEDHAGFDTWATMVRARSIFGVREAVVVTQGFHMPRALYLADEAGIDATGLTADLQGWGLQGHKSEAREVLSRVKALVDVSLDTPAMAGPKSRSPPPTAARAGARRRRPARRPPDLPASECRFCCP